jgi:5-formyltetrahydrofolate cyclo-ligase
MNKQALRLLYRKKRQTLSPPQYAQLNLDLYHHFFANIELSFVQVVHTFLPILGHNEPDTWLIVDRIRREFPHIRLSIPRTTQDGQLENYFFEGLHQLQTNALGIPEPKQGIPTPSERIDLVLVPLLCFDAHGHRVGYGKGYYDRFLQHCRPDCRKIGLSLFGPAENIDDVDTTDIALDACVTPTGLISFTH